MTDTPKKAQPEHNTQTFQFGQEPLITLTPHQVKQLKILDNEAGGNWQVWEHHYPNTWNRHAFDEVLYLGTDLNSKQLLEMLAK